MGNERIKKQLEENLVPNFVRLLRGRGPFVINFGFLVRAAAVSLGIMILLWRFFRFPEGLAARAFFYIFVTAVVFCFISGKKGTPVKEYDGFGNVIDQRNLYGSGRRLSQEEMRMFLDIFPESDPKGTILGVDPESGMCLGIPDVDRPYHRSLDHRHLLIMGASGRGKTEFIKNRHRQVLQQGFSDVYLDPKGEITEDVVWPCAEAMGYRHRHLIRFRTKDIHLSSRFDMLKGIRNAVYPETEARWLAGKILGYKETSDDKDYWEDSAMSLLVMSLLAAARCRDYVSIGTFLSTGDACERLDGHGTWKDAASVFEYAAEEVKSYFLYLRSICGENESLLRKHYNTWIGDERNWRGHISSVQKKISPIAQAGVAEVFSEDEIDFDAIATEPSILGIIYDIPPGEFSPSMNLVLQFVNAAILQRKTKHRVSIILEELKVTGYIDYLDDYFSFLRGYNAQIIACTQSYPQLIKLYGEHDANSFFQNAHVVFAGGQEPETLKKLEELNGECGINNIFFSTSVGGGSVRTTEREDVIKGAVIGRTELLYMPKGKLFVKLSNCGPAILETYDSTKHPLFGVRYVEKATGRYYDLGIDDIVPGFDADEKGLKIAGVPAVEVPDADENEDRYFVLE